MAILLNQILLGILIDSNLSFEEHNNNMCKETSQKLNALARISNYMGIQKRRTIMKSFITSQFSYCPLIWMFHSRSLNNRINSLHKRALRITYADKTPAFQQLLQRDNLVSIHYRNLQVLLTEIFKISKIVSSECLIEIFEEKANPYNFEVITLLEDVK